MLLVEIEWSLRPKLAYRVGSLACLLLIPIWVGALAGMAEHYRNYHYSDLAQVQWGNPGEFCPSRAGGRYCMRLVRPDSGSFKELGYTPLDEINLPGDHALAYVLARPAQEDLWFVYDLKAWQYVIKEVSFQRAVEEWRRLGLGEPTEFVQSSDPADKLQETRDSVTFRWSASLQLWFVFGLPVFVMFLLFAIATRRTFRRYQAQRSMRHLAMAILSFLPAAALLFLIVENFAGVIWQNIN